MLREWWSLFLDIIYPPRCPACRCEVDGHGQWCTACAGQVLAVRFLPLSAAASRSLYACQAVCSYEGAVKRLLRDMKFRSRQEAAAGLAWLAMAGNDRLLLPDAAVVVPVPLSAERLRERGFNQTELIFREWVHQRGFVWCEALQRDKATAPQWQLDRRARKKNLAGAFSVRPEHRGQLACQEVIIVDDIFTTGSTMAECARVLKRAGAGRVQGICLASKA